MTPPNHLRLTTRMTLCFSAFAFIAALAAFSTPLIATSAPSAPESAGPLAPTALRCEYLENPMGVDVPKPRFFWVLEHSERGQVQSAYQVVVSTDAKAATGDIWDSGKVASAKSTQVVFAGKSLESGKTYFWKVRTWDRDGREGL